MVDTAGMGLVVKSTFPGSKQNKHMDETCGAGVCGMDMLCAVCEAWVNPPWIGGPPPRKTMAFS